MNFLLSSLFPGLYEQEHFWEVRTIRFLDDRPRFVRKVSQGIVFYTHHLLKNRTNVVFTLLVFVFQPRFMTYPLRCFPW